MFGKNTAEYKGWIQRKKEMDNMSEHLQVVNTGSTSGYQAFDYKYWDVQGANFGSRPQTLYYDFEMLKRYSTHIDKEARIYICVEGFKFLVDQYSTDSANFKYYFYLDKEQILGYDDKTKKQLFYFPFIAKKYLIWQECISIVKKILAYKSKRNEFKSQKEKDQYYANLYLDGWYKQFGWLKEEEKLNTYQKEAIKINSKRLKKMLSYCEKYEWRPIIVIIPFSPNISSRLPENILENCLWRPLREIEEMGYQVIDLFQDEELSDYHLYEDAISFNDAGRNVFNWKIQKLSEKIIWEKKKIHL